MMTHQEATEGDAPLNASDEIAQLVSSPKLWAETPPLTPPRSILMIKSHSMGVGDLLRSSAAWRALKLRWPGVQLHLLFLSKHEGYPTEVLIKEHHLLSSAEFLVIQHGHPGLARFERAKVPFNQLIKSVQISARRCRADWVVDFEASGARTSLLTWFAARAVGARSLGIHQVFGRKYFYSQSAPSVQEFAKRFGYELPLEYTNRDFVALARWGIYRHRLPIELNVTPQGQTAKTTLLSALEQMPGGSTSISTPLSDHQVIVGLNIGCGTPDAMYKRPDLRRLAQCMLSVASKYPHRLVLTGAPNEREINEEFMAVYDSLSSNRGSPLACSHMINYAGCTDLSGLTGVIDACDVFITTDSGPYHMAVGLKRPTLVWFTYAEHTSFHDVDWCARVIDPQTEEFVSAFLRLLKRSGPGN